MDQYLRNEYLNDKHDLDEVSDLIAEIGPVFLASFDREPGSGAHQERERREGEGVQRVPVHAAGSAAVGRGGLPPGRRDAVRNARVEGGARLHDFTIEHHGLMRG